MARDSFHMREYTPVEVERREVDDLVVTCSDHRFQHAFDAILKNLFIERADRIVYPGPSIAIADGTLIPAIKKLEELHSFTNLHIMDHTDCGAFGGLDAFDWNELEEANAHYRKLEAAQIVIHEALPHITVVQYVVGLEEEITSPE